MTAIYILRDADGAEIGRSGFAISGTETGFVADDQAWLNVPRGAYVEQSIDLVRARAEAWMRIKAKRDAIQDGGVMVGNKWFHTDTKSRVQQLALFSLGQSLPPGILWKTMDGTFIELTPTLVQQIFAAGIAREQAVFTRAEVLRQAAEANDDPAAIDIESGWPVYFGG